MDRARASLRWTVSFVLLSTACQAPAVDPVEPPDAVLARDAAAGTVDDGVVVTTERGRSVEGRPIEVTEMGVGPETVLFLATIHGDENAGTPLLERLIEELRADAEPLTGRRAVIVPVVNPDGYAADARTNANRVDLNRNFPAANQSQARRGGEAPLSEPESRVIHDLIERIEPDRVVSIHQPVGCIDYDGPAEALAEAMAAACALPVRRLGGRPGSLGTWLGIERGVPTITFELPRRMEADAEANWDRYGPALFAALER